jgi:hypothetical protein
VLFDIDFVQKLTSFSYFFNHTIINVLWCDLQDCKKILRAGAEHQQRPRSEQSHLLSWRRYIARPLSSYATPC